MDKSRIGEQTTTLSEICLRSLRRLLRARDFDKYSARQQELARTSQDVHHRPVHATKMVEDFCHCSQFIALETPFGLELQSMVFDVLRQSPTYLVTDIWTIQINS